MKQARVASWSEIGAREATLVQRCASKDESACTELVGEHQRMVVQLAMNLLSDRDEALDLSQEVFLRVFRTIHRFRGQSSLRTWIHRIAVNQARPPSLAAASPGGPCRSTSTSRPRRVRLGQPTPDRARAKELAAAQHALTSCPSTSAP